MFQKQQTTSENSSETTESNFAVIINDILQGKKSLSYSSLKQFLSSPKHFKEYKTGVFEQTPSMKEGVMFHMACLEPERFKEEYWVLDDSAKILEIGGAKPRATKAYKEWIIEEEAKHKGERISQELFDTFTNMSEALRQNSSSGRYMNNITKTEGDYTAEYDGFKIKYKVDAEGKTKEEGEFIADLKKVADASFDKVKWDIRRMRYHMQGGMYSEFKGVRNYILIYIDKGCNITVVKLNEDTLADGFAMFEGAIENFTECAKNNLWNSSYEFWNGGYINF